MENWLSVYVTWLDLFAQIPHEVEVRAELAQFDRQSTIILLCRLAAQLFVDRFRRNSPDTVNLQGYLAANFWDDEVLSAAKEKFGTDRLDFRRAFHLHQILMLLKWVITDSATTGGVVPDSDQSARHSLGRCLLKTSDLLLSPQMRRAIENDRRSKSVNKYLNAQLQMGCGMEINNPPPIPNGVARGQLMFLDTLPNLRAAVNLAEAFRDSVGLELGAYIDLTFGALANYLSKQPRDLINDASHCILNPETFFGCRIDPLVTKSYWQLEAESVADAAAKLSSPGDLPPHQDFRQFRIKPFLFLDSGNAVCVNPGFLQEKLEIGLFWRIVNSLGGGKRQKCFEVWGTVFEEYLSRVLSHAVDSSKERFFSFPKFVERGNRHEAFDGLLLSERICVVLEYKAGFLPQEAKYREDRAEFASQLDLKFGTASGAGIEQLVRKISQVFSPNERTRRCLDGIDLAGVAVVVPVLIVQDNFASSVFVLPWLAKLFRDEMRRKILARGVVWTGLQVLHVEDVENMCRHVKAGQLTATETILFAAKRGDPAPKRLFAFSDSFRDLLQSIGSNPINNSEIDVIFREVLNRLTLRLFDREFEPGSDSGSETRTVNSELS